MSYESRKKLCKYLEAMYPKWPSGVTRKSALLREVDLPAYALPWLQCQIDNFRQDMNDFATIFSMDDIDFLIKAIVKEIICRRVK